MVGRHLQKEEAGDQGENVSRRQDWRSRTCPPSQPPIPDLEYGGRLLGVVRCAALVKHLVQGLAQADRIALVTNATKPPAHRPRALQAVTPPQRAQALGRPAPRLPTL